MKNASRPYGSIAGTIKIPWRDEAKKPSKSMFLKSTANPKLNSLNMAFSKFMHEARGSVGTLRDGLASTKRLLLKFMANDYD